jgi:DNA (cytosine-5)-methyltransferase 1
VIVNPYGGPGGWDVGLQEIGLDCVGIELDTAACLTRAAAGHRTIRADVAAFPLDHLVGLVEGAILSPPCQAFSTAGKGAGRDVLPDLADAIRRGDWGWSHDDDRVRHVLEVGRWAETLRPRWVACEQVPPVLPLWRAYADRWRHLYGWSTWAGVLNAADYGVPQTRRRAFLIARTDGQPATPPAPTHCQGGALTLDGELAPWITMADALGWSDEDTPARTLAGNRSPRWLYPDSDGTHGRVLDRRQQSDGEPVRLVDCDTEPAPTLTGIAGAKSQWVFRQPATTVAGDPRITARCHHDEGSQGARAVTVEQAMTGDYDGTSPIRLTIRDALILQGFPADYPVQGTRTKQFEQVGNAVPPPLAAAVIGALTGVTARQAAA